MKIDRTDREILALLTKNARISNKALADRVGLAPSSCHERVLKLRARGVLRGFHAEVDPALLGVGLQAMVAIRLRQHSRDSVDAFRAAVLERAEVVALYHVTGADDFLVHVAARDADHLREITLSAFTEQPEVAHIETRLIFEHARRWELAIPPQAGPAD
ncbi:MAG: Lrp/AsnC family transcriptional regulator [Gammaproteobacteria bacterium]